MFYFNIFVCIFFSSCATLKFPKTNDAIIISKENRTQINGDYHNNVLDTSTTKWLKTLTLWKIINPEEKTIDSSKAVLYSNAKVHLQFENDKTLLVKLYNADTILAEKKYKGKFKDGFFLVKRKVKYFGLPFIYMRFSQYRCRIGKDISNHLIVDKAEERFGWIFIFSAGTNYTNSYKFVAR